MGRLRLFVPPLGWRLRGSGRLVPHEHIVNSVDFLPRAIALSRDIGNQPNSFFPQLARICVARLPVVRVDDDVLRLSDVSTITQLPPILILLRHAGGSCNKRKPCRSRTALRGYCAADRTRRCRDRWRRTDNDMQPRADHLLLPPLQYRGCRKHPMSKPVVGCKRPGGNERRSITKIPEHAIRNRGTRRELYMEGHTLTNSRRARLCN